MKRLFYLLIGLVLLPTLLFAQIDYSGKGLYTFITTYYYQKTDVYTKTQSDARYPSAAYFYDTAEVDAKLADKADTDSVYTKTAADILLALKANKTYVDSSDESIIASLASYALKTYVNATDETIMLDDDSQDVQIESNRVTINTKASQTEVDSNEAALIYETEQIGAINSSGKLSGGIFTNDGSGGLNYTTMEVAFKTSDSNTAPLSYHTIPAGNIPAASMTTNEVHYAYANYNAGSPQVLVTTDRSTIRTTDQFDLLRFYKNTTTCYIGTYGMQTFNFPRREHERTFARGVAERYTGAIIAEKATRYVTITESTWYGGTTAVNKAASDSQTDGFEHYYSYNAGTDTWEDHIATYPNQIDNQKYNDTSDGTLKDLTNNQYGVHWIYVGGSSKLSVVFGHNTYKLNEAIAVQPPIKLPSYLEKFSVLVGRIIIKKSASTFTAIDSVFDQNFVTSVVEHNDTINRDTADAHPAAAITYTDTYSIAATTVQSAIDTLEAWLGGFVTDSFVYGFVDPVTATLSYDATTQTFTITGSHEIYINGKRVTKGTASKTHPATTGMHYFYYDSNGVLQTSTDLWGGNFFTVAQIAYVYYNASKVTTPQGLMFDEEHSHIMTTATHYYLHSTRGAVSSDLFPLGNYSTAPAVPTNAGNQFSATGGTLSDEDHRETIADVPDGGYYPIFWREGVAGDWTWSSGTYPVSIGVGATYPSYNQLTGGSWTTTEVTHNQYMNMYTAVTNAADSTYSVILIMGQNVYSTLALAQAANPINTLSLGSLPFNEIIITNKITFRTNSGYSTIGKCRIESVESLAGITIRLGGAVVATSHSGLSNRTDPGSHPASAVSYVDTYNLGVTDVQSALDTIELWLSAIDVTDDSQDVAINSAEVAINGIIVGSGYATTAQVSQEVLVHNADANAHSTKFADYYTADQTDSTIEAAIAAIPAPSVNQTVTVTAGEALTTGQVVSLINESGTIKAYNIPLTVNTSPNGAESAFNSAATTYCSAVALDSTRFLVAYQKADTYGYAKVGTVTGSAIAWGSECTAYPTDSANAATLISTCKIATDKILVVFKRATANIQCTVLSISDSTISVSAPVVIDNNYPGSISVCALAADTAIVCYSETETSNTGQCKIITVSGTTPTPYPASGSAGTTFNVAPTSYISVSALSSTSAIVAYQDGGNSSYGTAQVLSISGTTITPGTEYVFKEVNPTRYINCCAMNSTQAVITYDPNNFGYAIIATNSSGTISYNTETQFNNSATVYSSTAKMDSTHFIASFYDNNNTYGTQMIGTINGSNISFGSKYVFTTGASNYQSVCYLGSNKSVISYTLTSPTTYGYAVVNTWATSSYASVSGISSGTYSSGSDAVVLISGVSDDQSGLITGSPYYLATDFTLQTTPVSLTPTSLLNAGITGEIKIGTAKSATELIIGIDYK